MKNYEIAKKEEIKHLDIGIDYLAVIKDECQAFKDEGFEIYYIAQGSMVTN